MAPGAAVVENLRSEMQIGYHMATQQQPAMERVGTENSARIQPE
jgi:hypothetical protein